MTDVVATPSVSLSEPSAADVSAFSTLIRSLSTECSSLFSSSTSLLPSHLPSSSSSSSQDESTADSFLTLKSTLLLSYTQHLFLLSSHRALGLSIQEGEGKEVVERLVRIRVTLDKMKALEARLRPKWERLVRAVQNTSTSAKSQAGGSDDEDEGEEEDQELDPLSFRPNPSALLDPTSAAKKKSTAAASSSSSSRKAKGARAAEESDEDQAAASRSGVYRPPKLAPVPYSDRPRTKGRRGDGSSDEERDDSRSRRGGGGGRPLNAHLLPDLSTSLSSNPYSTSSTGLTSLSASDPHTSARARRLREMDEYEENNFTRLVLSKKDERKRRRDEEDVVLGGATTAGLSSSRGGSKVGAGLEEEFGDLLRGGERRGGKGQSRREWDDLTSKRRKATAPAGESEGRRGGGKKRGGGSTRGGNRFEKAVASQGKTRR